MLKFIFKISLVIGLLCTVFIMIFNITGKHSKANLVTAVVNTRKAYVSETTHFQLIDIDRRLRIKIFPAVEELLDVQLWSGQYGVLLTREKTPDAAIFRIYGYDILNGKPTLLHQSSSPDRNRSFSILSDYTMQLSHQQNDVALYDPVTSQLYVINLKTGASQQILTFNQMVSFPVLIWSPDDSQIAFRQDYQTLTLINADASNPRTFTELSPNEIYPVWSADSSKILLSPGPVLYKVTSTISIIDAQTGESLPNASAIKGAHPLWCEEDNRYLAFAREQDRRLEIIDLETGGSQVFDVPLDTHFEVQLLPILITWKSNCAGVIFQMESRYILAPNDLYYAGRDSGETQHISDPVIVIDIEENGDLIVYERSSAPPSNIQLYRLAGDDFQKILIGEYFYSGDWLQWSDDFSMAFFPAQNGGTGRLEVFYKNDPTSHFLTGLYEFALAYRLWD